MYRMLEMIDEDEPNLVERLDLMTINKLIAVGCSDLHPECGIYFLFREHDMTYIGRSENVRHRVACHRKDGRAFDLALALYCDIGESIVLERQYIAAYQPMENKIGKGRERILHELRVRALERALEMDLSR
jgi:hypothetical protein